MFVAVEDDAVPTSAQYHQQMQHDETVDHNMRIFWELLVPVAAGVSAVGVFFITQHFAQFVDFTKLFK